MAADAGLAPFAFGTLASPALREVIKFVNTSFIASASPRGFVGELNVNV
jgi:hypothetical protein